MRAAVRIPTILFLPAISLVAGIVPAYGEVTSVTGTATALVVHQHGATELQRDFNQQIVPLTNDAPPITARSKLDRLLEDGEVPAAGQVVAILHEPNLTGSGRPNDAGLDLGAFSDDDFSSWIVEGTVTEVRTLVLHPADIGGDVRRGSRTRVEGRVVLSGVMLITADEVGKDLSDVNVRFRFHVIQRSPDHDPVEVLAGLLVLAGDANGVASITEVSGAMAGAFLPVIEFPNFIEALPVVQAVPFTGLEFPYTYDVVVGEPFDLELFVEATLHTTPDGTGAAAVFGLPQEGIASVIERVKEPDLGKQLTDMIAREVDTTGEAYKNGGGTIVGPSPFLFPACGLMGFETTGLAAVAIACFLWGHIGRRRNAGRPEG